jgi:hypothetical protein
LNRLHLRSLPGGFVLEDEGLDEAAQRILSGLTGMSRIFMEQVRAFGEVNRYPLRRVITIAYYALVKPEVYKLEPGWLADEAGWVPVKDLPELVFDHEEILENTLNTLRKKVRHEPVGFEMLPDKFSLTELQQLYEAILDLRLDKRNFRKKLMKMSLLVPSGETQQGVAHRAAHLYKFDEKVYKTLQEKGFSFEL